jgi:hypothetical protein
MTKKNILNHEGGWCGGQWTLNGITDFEHLSLSIMLDGKRTKLSVVPRIGTDYDHGHEYKWSNIDYVVKMALPGFKKPVTVSLREQGMLPIEVSLEY